jgi:hypothetical protein
MWGPNIVRVKSLVGTAWSSIHAQGGRLHSRSECFDGAWTATAFEVHGATDVLIVGKAWDVDGGEVFGLIFSEGLRTWSPTLLKRTRPAFAPVLSWPPDAKVPEAFFRVGPTALKLGLGSPIAGRKGGEPVIPILWCSFASFRRGDDELMFYADEELPCSIGVVASNHVARQIR